ncbi:MAG: hypothetical protein REI78_09500 [Pedobacter sp.]|nr:hypothetical protein [Pedobacter sp.]
MPKAPQEFLGNIPSGQLLSLNFATFQPSTFQPFNLSTFQPLTLQPSTFAKGMSVGLSTFYAKGTHEGLFTFDFLLFTFDF